MIGRIGGGRQVETTASEAFGCFFFIFMPIVGFLTGQGWIGAVLYMIIGIAIPTVHYWWKKREARKWRENDVGAIFAQLERGKYTKLSFRNYVGDELTPNEEKDYRISAIQFDSKTLELEITVTDYEKFEKVIKLDELSYRSVCDRKIPCAKVICIKDVRIGWFNATGYFVFE